MAEKDKIFYWIKLKKEFLDSETVDFLMSNKNGANYVVLYQLLIMKTINTNGELCNRIGEVIIPFDAEKIQRDCKWFDIDTVRVAMELYMKLGLIYQNKNGILQIANFDELVGNETYWAKQKRLQREKKDVGQIPTDVQNPLISNIYNLNSNILDIDNNTKDNNKNDNRNKKNNNRVIYPTLEQVEEYAKQRGRDDLSKSFYDYYSTGDWKDSKGNKVKNWKQKFITWEQHNQKTNQSEKAIQKEYKADNNGVYIIH